MAKEKETQTYWKEVGLVFIGALLASIPTLISTNMQGKAQLQQIVLDKRLAALKDYSIVSSKAVTDILPRVEALEEKLSEVDTPSTFRRKSPRIFEDIKSESQQYNNWVAEMNAQTVTVDALFGKNYPQIEMSGNGSEEKSEDDINHVESETLTEVIKSFRKMLAEKRKALLENIELKQNIVRELSLEIQKNVNL